MYQLDPFQRITGLAWSPAVALDPVLGESMPLSPPAWASLKLSQTSAKEVFPAGPARFARSYAFSGHHVERLLPFYVRDGFKLARVTDLAEERKSFTQVPVAEIHRGTADDVISGSSTVVGDMIIDTSVSKLELKISSQQGYITCLPGQWYTLRVIVSNQAFSGSDFLNTDYTETITQGTTSNTFVTSNRHLTANMRSYNNTPLVLSGEATIVDGTRLGSSKHGSILGYVVDESFQNGGYYTDWDQSGNDGREIAVAVILADRFESTGIRILGGGGCELNRLTLRLAGGFDEVPSASPAISQLEAAGFTITTPASKWFTFTNEHLRFGVEAPLAALVSVAARTFTTNQTITVKRAETRLRKSSNTGSMSVRIINADTLQQVGGTATRDLSAFSNETDNVSMTFAEEITLPAGTYILDYSYDGFAAEIEIALTDFIQTVRSERVMVNGANQSVSHAISTRLYGRFGA